MPIKVELRENGPYLIRGDAIELLDADGNPLAFEGDVIALCRCGHSSNKPFCDGTHRNIDFDGSPTATR